jgi:hypothetical protein
MQASTPTPEIDTRALRAPGVTVDQQFING